MTAAEFCSVVTAPPGCQGRIEGNNSYVISYYLLTTILYYATNIDSKDGKMEIFRQLINLLQDSNFNSKLLAVSLGGCRYTFIPPPTQESFPNLFNFRCKEFS